MRAGGLLLASLLFLGACTASKPLPSCAGLAGAPSLEISLLLGRDRAGPAPGSAPVPIAEPDFARFLETEVTRRLPDGFTVLDGSGQWRDPATGIIGRERSSVLMVIAPDEPATLDRVNEIAERYKSVFQQKSVGIVIGRVCAGF